jgi:hypothetical protein
MLLQIQVANKHSILSRLIGCKSAPLSIYEDDVSSSNNNIFNRLLMRYLFWAFRHSFLEVLLSGVVAFLLWIMVFAIIIWGLGMINPTCISGVDSEQNYFLDSFSLSWTTFSTVVSASWRVILRTLTMFMNTL